MKFLIINGPNLNLLGQREPGIYGRENYESLCRRLKDFAAAHGAAADCFQSNHEGAIIDAIHAAQGVYDAIVMNPGAFTHYSYAILDARIMVFWIRGDLEWSTGSPMTQSFLVVFFNSTCMPSSTPRQSTFSLPAFSCKRK